MRKKKLGALLMLLSGSTMFGGCLGSYWNALLSGLPGSILTEFLTDNGGIWDIFPDGPATAP